MYLPKQAAVVSGLIIVLFLAGCTKEESVSPAENSLSKNLTAINSDNGSYSILEYQENKLIKYEVFHGTERTLAVTLQYGEQKRPKSENSISNNGEFLKNFYYDSLSRLDSTLLQHKVNSSGYVKDGYIKYYYNAKNQAVKEEQYNDSDEMLFTTTYKYNAADNITETHTYAPDGYDEITTMKYDDNINPWHNLKDNFFYLISVSPNNVTSYSTIYSQFETTTANYNYSYDSEGYPGSCTIISEKGARVDTLTQIFEYN